MMARRIIAGRRRVASDGLGPELIVNGTFDTADGWVIEKAVITNGRVEVTNGTRFLAQNIGLEIGKSYRMTIDYFFIDGWNLRLGTTDSNAGLPYYIFATGNTQNHADFIFTAHGEFVAIEADQKYFSGWVDNISVREVL